AAAVRLHHLGPARQGLLAEGRQGEPFAAVGHAPAVRRPGERQDRLLGRRRRVAGWTPLAAGSHAPCYGGALDQGVLRAALEVGCRKSLLWFSAGVDPPGTRG